MYHEPTKMSNVTNVVKERDAAPYGPGLAEKAFVGFRRAGDFRGRCQAVARPPLEIEHTPFTGFECRRPLVQRPEDHPFGACGDTRPEPLRDLPCRGAEYLPSAGRDIAALHFGDPERVFPGSGADDVGHERDSQRVLRPGEITEVPAQVHRHAQRGQKPFVGGEIVVGEVVQKLVGIDVFVVRRVVQIDLRCDPSQVPRREVGVEPLLREVGFQVAVVVGRSLLCGFPACENLVGQVVSPGPRSARPRFVLQHPGVEGGMPPEVAHDGFDVTGDFQQVGFRAGEFESAHVAQLVGRREERGEEFYAVFPGGIECFVVKREIPRSVRAQHVRPEHPDACRFESVLREYPEEPVDLLVGLPRFDEHLRPDLRVFGALRVKGLAQESQRQ